MSRDRDRETRDVLTHLKISRNIDTKKKGRSQRGRGVKLTSIPLTERKGRQIDTHSAGGRGVKLTPLPLTERKGRQIDTPSAR